VVSRWWIVIARIRAARLMSKLLGPKVAECIHAKRRRYAMRQPNTCEFYYMTTFLTLTLLSIGVLCAWGQTKPNVKLIEEAKKEGEVVFYAGMSPAEANVMQAKFQAKYPFLQLKLNRIGGNRMAAKVFTEARAGQNLVDLIQTSEFDLYTFQKNGILAYYISPEDRFYPREYKEQGYWTAYQLSLIVVGYNTKMVAPQNLPKTYDDLLNPAWKGKIMLDPTKSEWFAGMLEIMGREKGLRYMKDLSKQDIVLRQGNALRAQLVSAGEAVFDINIPTHTVDQLKKSGAPIDWLALGPVPARMSTIGIAAKAPHPHAARLLLDFWLSREGQRLVDSFNRVVTRSDLAEEQSAAIKGLRIVPVNPALGEELQGYEKLLRDIFVSK